MDIAAIIGVEPSMNKNHKELISIGLTLGIIGLTLFIVYRFIPSMIWAGIIVISTYPAYQRWARLFPGRNNCSAALFTVILSLLLILPLSWLTIVLIQEFQIFLNYLQEVNRIGGSAPPFFQDIPVLGQTMIQYWDENIGKPGNVRDLLSHLHLSLTPASYYLRQVGMTVTHRGFQVGFTVMTLFFFYRDGETLFKQINHLGDVCLGERWFQYADRLPSALRATVNGTLAVGIGVGVLMGTCYALVGFPAPTLLGFITAFAAMIPFFVPVVFLVVALILIAYGSMLSALIVVIWGTIVMFLADHFVKPVLIGGAIQLPFLAVLFGILGGVESLGLLGLFLGPIIMVLFITLWQESQRFNVSVKVAQNGL